MTAGIARGVCASAGLASLLILSPAGAAEISDPSSLQGRDGDIVLLGEIHDNPRHHLFQDAAIDVLSPAAIVFEMLSPEDADLITPELAADPEALAAAISWAESGWPDFAMYYPLLARGAHRPVYGAQVPRDIARAAFAGGAAAVFPGDAARFGLTDALYPDEQAAREAGQQEAHCNALPADILPGFVEAQRLRDAALADAALRALELHGAPVVVITGNGHARRDWGVPALLARAAREATVLSLGQFEAPPEGAVPFDLWTVAAPVDRPDPCAAFR